MPTQVKRNTRSQQPYYMIPIALGLAGVLFSTQLEDPIVQGVIILLCLAVPLFLGGNLLGRIHSDGFQRILLVSGMAALTLGAILAVTGLSERLVDHEYVSVNVGTWSDRLGMASLILGLMAVLYSMLRSEAIIDQVVDRFRHVANHISEGFILVDEFGSIILVNRSLLLTLGLSEEDIIGKNVWEFSKSLGVEAFDNPIEPEIVGKRRTFEAMWKRHGQERYYEVTDTPIVNRQHHKEGELFIIRDVTEQHNLSARLEHYTVSLHELVDEQTKLLRESEEQLRNLLIHMNEGFILVDDEFKISFANAYVGDMLKVLPEDLQTRNVFEFIPQEDYERLQESFSFIVQEQVNEASQEFNFIRSDGRYLPIKVSIAKAQGEYEHTSQFSMVITDLEELKNMQYELESRAAQLELANDELRELDRAKDTLLTNVSHELRTPLSTIEGYVEMFLSGNLGEVDAPQVGALNVMTRNIDRLSTMIHEMIEFSRMEIKGIRLNETVFNLSNMLDECVSSAHPDAYQNRVKLKLSIEHELLPVWGDRTKLVQVMGILLSNAVKFSHEKSDVDISLDLNEIGDVTISVQDYGIGIDKLNQEQIFKKFYQVDSTMTRNFEGTGIGLSIANNIMKAHGGSIEVHSSIDEGARFTLVLKNALFTGANLSSSECSIEGCLVYITNTDIEFRGACRDILVSMGAEVHEFYAAHESFRHAQKVKPDFVLMGEHLPDVSGPEAIRLFSENVLTKDIAVVLMQTTTYGPENSNEDGQCAILWKPFTPYELIQNIRSVWTPTKVSPE